VSVKNVGETKKIGAVEQTEGVVDVDWYMEEGQSQHNFEVDREKAAINGVSVQQVAETLAVVMAGRSASSTIRRRKRMWTFCCARPSRNAPA
jgi:multidrug efflux pump subunit AcrB